MMMIVHLNPFSPSSDLVFDQTTPTGGDMGAHVWAPAYLRDHLLPHFKLSGWSMDWYGGLPIYRFYMVVPGAGHRRPRRDPARTGSRSSSWRSPDSCSSRSHAGRSAGSPPSGTRSPSCSRSRGLCFLLDESFQIYGGNVKSTMAGEFSFSIALTLAMFGLGLLAAGLRTGKYRVSAAIVLSLAAVSHGIVLIFVAVSAIILCLVWIDRSRFVYAITTGATTLLLSAWWVGPFLFGHQYMTDMKYGFRPEGASDSFFDMFFPLTTPLDIIITTLAIVGFVAMIMRRNLTGTALGLIAIAFVGLVYLTRDSLPLIGLLVESAAAPVRLPHAVPADDDRRPRGDRLGGQRRARQAGVRADDRVRGCDRRRDDHAVLPRSCSDGCTRSLPFDGRVTRGDTTAYAWGPFRKTPDAGRAVADGWTRYNMVGYEGRSAYPEYHDVVETMDEIGQERGCGRALWENNEDNGQYGTTMALMLLPHWTDGCIASMEGLFFEASGTTPYHFLTAAAMSKSSSNPVRQLRYENNDATVGAQHMADLGVRYLMVRTDEAKAEAAGNDRLDFVTSSGPWDIYELAEARDRRGAAGAARGRRAPRRRPA